MFGISFRPPSSLWKLCLFCRAATQFSNLSSLRQGLGFCLIADCQVLLASISERGGEHLKTKSSNKLLGLPSVLNPLWFAHSATPKRSTAKRKAESFLPPSATPSFIQSRCSLLSKAVKGMISS